jgi:ABC-2 type transport system ATP-binding protein
MTAPPAVSTARAIEAVDLTKTFPARPTPVRALDGLTFAVDPGTIFGLLGPNGAGKSTAIRILTTLSRPDGGHAAVAGFDVARQPAAVRRVIGVVGQRSGLDIDATAAENLVLQGEVHGLSPRHARSRAAELLERVDLGEHGDRLVRTLSGGMQRKLDIALGLVHGPRVLFLDEPTTGLDPEARAGLWVEITRLAADDGLTIVLTTHYLEEADQLADRVAIVEHGRVVVEGEPDALKGELRGDTITVELDGAGQSHGPEVAHAVLASVAGIRDLVVDGTTLVARADVGAQAVPAVLGALDGASLTVAAVTVSRPSLDDVYLRYAGRSFTKEMAA